MPTAAEVTALEFQIDIDGRAAQSQIRKIEQQWKQSTTKIKAATKDYDHYVKNVVDSAEEFGVAYTSSIKMTSKQLTALNQKMAELAGRIDLADRKGANASGNQKKRYEAVTNALKGQLDVLKQIEGAQGSANYERVFKDVAKNFGADLKKESEKAFSDALEGAAKYSKVDMAAGMTEAFRDAAGSLKGKDFGGLAKSLGGMIGSGAKGLGGMATRAGLRAQSDPNAGVMAKAMGGMVGKMGPLVSTIAKLGPVLSAAGGAVMAIVKLFLDAEAAAKEFNKEVLATASTGEFLTKNAGSATMAFNELDETLTSIRDHATSLDNLKWGINKKDHTAFLNVLNAEGVSLARIKTEAEQAGKSAGAFETDMIHVALAYSKNFGVTLQEISSFQAEMMTELGSSFQSAQGQFALMAQAAGESGMAQNKFFNIIKSVSSDLSLYNMRLEDSVQLLSMLGKTMNPRNAQKFMQETMQGFKNMGRTEKLKLTLLAGQADTDKALKNDFASKTKDYAAKIQAGGAKGSLDQIQAAVAKGGDAAEKYIQQMSPELQGAIRESVTQLDIDKKRSGKGAFGKATAIGNMGMGGALDLYKSAILRLSPGSKSLEDASGTIGGEMMADQLGISQERLDGMIKLERAVTAQKKVLVASAQKEGKSAQEIADIEKMNTQEVISTMSEEAQKQLKNETKTIDYAQRQTELTSSVLDKLDTIMDWLMNQAYRVLTSLLDVAADIFDIIPGSKGRGAYRKAEAEVIKAGNKELLGVLDKSGGSIDTFRQELYKSDMFKRQEKVLYGGGGSMSPEQTKAMGESQKTINDMTTKWGSVADLTAKAAKATNKQDKDFLEQQLADWKAAIGTQKSITDSKGAGAAAFGKIADAIDAQVGHGSSGGDRSNARRMSLHKAFGMAGMDVNNAKYGALSKGIGEGKTISQAMEDAGYSQEEMAKVLDKIRLTLTPGQLAQAMADAEKSGAPAKPAAGASGTPAPGIATPGVVPGTPGAPTVGPGTKKDEMPANTKQAEATQATLEDIHDGQTKVKLSKPFTKGPLKDAMHDGVLEALRIALYEYWMYSGLDKDDMLKSGMSPAQIGPAVVKQLTKSGSVAAGGAEIKAKGLTDNAAGGTVLNPAPGEVIASVAPGETIVPKGGFKGGGNTVNQTFAAGTDQNFAKYIEGKTKQAIIDWERAKRLR